MSNYDKILSNYGIKVPEIMLPADGVSMEKWSVIACDQYTSQKDYWQRAAQYTAGEPSALNLIFPECYLEDGDTEARIASINRTMKEYIDKSVLAAPEKGFIMTKRDTPKHSGRWGLMAALDLEHYDFSAGSKSLIRATEGTILDRIPPRVRIRKNASLELPHIMVLIDDPDNTIIEPLTKDLDSFEKLYNFDLMMDSGHLTGYRVKSEKHLNRIAEAFQTLGAPETLKRKYGESEAFLFAMGDGNHSLATAKTIWQNYKKNNSGDQNLMNHPSRWALVELVNIYSGGIEFEAIHRVLFDISEKQFLETLEKNGDFRLFPKDNLDEALKKIEKESNRQLCAYSNSGSYGIIEALNPDNSIMAGTIQNFIDGYIDKTSSGYVDYIHGIDVTDELGSKDGNVGLFLPSISKATFFETVMKEGAFPRKTFSMGEAYEKRFYTETRKIK